MNYTFEPTLDGSLTLRFAEPMHSSHGAFAETVFNYGQGVREVISRGWPARFLSIGLGLGYVEFVCFAYLLSQRKTSCLIESYEQIPELRDYLTLFLDEPDHLRRLQPDFYRVYEDIVARCSREYQIDGRVLRERMREALATGELRLLGAFDMDHWPKRRFHGVFFDAFSSQSSPELWTPELLDRLCEELCEPKAVFATYAATGNLKRALTRHGFGALREEGFGGKRESTLAARGV